MEKGTPMIRRLGIKGMLTQEDDKDCQRRSDAPIIVELVKKFDSEALTSIKVLTVLGSGKGARMEKNFCSGKME
jgi:hypothetical protein